LAFMGALLAELFEANAGIGYLVNQLYSKGLIAQMLSTIFAMFLLILLINAGLQAVQNRMTRWRRE
jgi:ABC-type nitrate/sulfonate/bicarbonate transport system permease component